MSDVLLSARAFNWLSRVTYGVSPQLTSGFLALGADDLKRWSAYLNDQLNAQVYFHADVESKIEKLNLKTLKLTLPELWKNHFLASRQMRMLESEQSDKPMTAKQEKAQRKARRELALDPVLELESATWMRMVYSPFQIYERIVEFWHDHFNIFAYEGRIAPAFVELNRDVIRVHGLGNFRKLLQGVCRNPAMLVYLDNAFNQSGNPNENFARELFELHTLGAENYLGTTERDKVVRDKDNRPVGYVDGDVYEAARAFTGWRVEDGTAGLAANTGLFFYSDAWHDRFQKIILGERFPEHQPPMRDGERVLEILCAHPGTARYISRKLCRRFVSDQPSETFVQRVARYFLEQKDSPTQIRDTVRMILTSDEFLDDTAQKFKRPIDYFVSLIRALELEFAPQEKWLNAVHRCGHRLFGWRTPDGPPDVAAPWQSPQSLIERWKVAQQTLSMLVPASGIEAELSKLPQTPENLTIALGRRLVGPRMTDTLREHVVKLAAGGRRTDFTLPAQLVGQRVLQVAEVIAMSPEFQVR